MEALALLLAGARASLNTQYRVTQGLSTEDRGGRAAGKYQGKGARQLVRSLDSGQLSALLLTDLSQATRPC